ncbi:hypothetical protein Tco_0552345, partial [Tanacetum coccineum]
MNFDDDIEEMDIADSLEGTELLGVSTDDDSASHLCKNGRKENELETNCGTSEPRTS